MVFPAPFGPRKPNTSPRCTVIDSEFTAIVSPKRLLSPTVWIAGEVVGSEERSLAGGASAASESRTGPDRGRWLVASTRGSLSRVGPRHSAHLADRGFRRRHGAGRGRPPRPPRRPRSRSRPAARPASRRPRTERAAAPGGTGTGRIVRKSPSRRTSSASSRRDARAAPAGKLRSDSGLHRWTAPSDGASSRRQGWARPRPLAAPYSARTAGPASSVTELPARPAAVGVEAHGGASRAAARRTAGRPPRPREGGPAGRPESRLPRRPGQARTPGGRCPRTIVMVPNRSVLDPFGVEKPPSAWLSPSPREGRDRPQVALAQLRPGRRGLARKWWSAWPPRPCQRSTIPTAPIASPARSDTLGNQRSVAASTGAGRRAPDGSACLRPDASSRRSRAQATSMSGTSCGAENSWAARSVSSRDLGAPGAAAPTASTSGR